MGLIQDLVAKYKERKERISGYAEDDKIRTTFEQRKLSNNERELNDYLEKERQKRIDGMVNRFKERDKQEYWHKDIISQKNIFGGQKCIFANQKSILKTDRRAM